MPQQVLCKYQVELRELLHPVQLEFLRDPNPYRALLGGRRGGKTVALAAFLIDGALERQGSLNLYVSLSQKHARLRMWRPLRLLIARLGIPHVVVKGDLAIVLLNGSTIRLDGCNDRPSVERFRGSAYGRVAIDEAAFFGDGVLHDLITDALQPALLDLRGELAIASSPGYVPSGYFYEATTGTLGWSVRTWTAADNPTIIDFDGYLAEVLRLNGWSRDNPKFRREYLAEWILDLDSLVYPFSAINQIDRLPDGPNWTYIIGIDLGYEHASAWVVLAESRTYPALVVVEAHKRYKQLAGQVADYTEELRKIYSPKRTVADTGGFGKGYVEEMRRRYGIPVLAADKTDKLGCVEHIAGDIKTGKVQVVADNCKALLGEASNLAWSDRHDEIRDGADHCCDAFLYGSKESYHWTYKSVRKRPEDTPGTIEYQEKKMREHSLQPKGKRQWLGG
jgi:hypothetical protein